MDSLTQIVLGASVGELVLGKKIGNKAMLYGAIGGTIPDLDVFASYFTDTVHALTIHRGFTHSIFFAIVMSPIFSWIITRYETYKDFRKWCWFFFWVLVTHPILDAHTTWGTQLLWPLESRLAFKTIFVIDPIYTLPLLFFIILTLFQNKNSPKRRKYNSIGLLISTTYLGFTFILQACALNQFQKALEIQNINYNKIDIRPSPLNTILWNANVETEKEFLLAEYSFFDKMPIQFIGYPKNHHLLEDLLIHKKVQQMIAISEGWYSISKINNTLYYNDLRFGLLNLKSHSQDFVFQYKIDLENKQEVTFTEVKKSRGDAKKLLQKLWSRILGN